MTKKQAVVERDRDTETEREREMYIVYSLSKKRRSIFEPGLCFHVNWCSGWVICHTHGVITTSTWRGAGMRTRNVRAEKSSVFLQSSYLGRTLINGRSLETEMYTNTMQADALSVRVAGV